MHKTDPEIRNGRELIFERMLNAPRDLVFSVWTDPAHLARWWGPQGFTTTTNRHDFRTGGYWDFIMHGPDGTDYKNKIIFDCIDKPRLISYRHAGDGETEDITFQVTVKFEEVEGMTRLTMSMLFPTEAELNRVVEKYGAIEGGIQNLARLKAHIIAQQWSDRDLVITRIFPASRELVWEAWTDPDRIKLWWGPANFTAPHASIDLRIGGKYHFCMRSPDGQDYWSGGTYLEFRRPELLVFTDHFSDPDGNPVHASTYGMEGDWPLEMYVYITLEEKEGETKLTLRHSGLPAGEISRLTGVGWNASFDKMESLFGSK